MISASNRLKKRNETKDLPGTQSIPGTVFIYVNMKIKRSLRFGSERNFRIIADLTTGTAVTHHPLSTLARLNIRNHHNHHRHHRHHRHHHRSVDGAMRLGWFRRIKPGLRRVFLARLALPATQTRPSASAWDSTELSR